MCVNGVCWCVGFFVLQDCLRSARAIHCHGAVLHVWRPSVIRQGYIYPWLVHQHPLTLALLRVDPSELALIVNKALVVVTKILSGGFCYY